MGERILVVDDEKTIREIVSQVLTDEGHEVTAFPSGEEALASFRDNPYPLVITDIRMDGMSGLDLLKEIKVIRPETQVVLITGYASLDSALTGMRAGACEYLVKPFEDVGLIASVADSAIKKTHLLETNRGLIDTLKNNNENLERVNQFLKEQASRDGLTRLYNHRHFHESLAGEINRSSRYNHIFSLIFLDVDLFKQYNDTHGHLMGDRLLRELGEVLAEQLRKTDLVARYGGEEFMMILPETDKENARRVAEKIRKTIEEHSFPSSEKQSNGKITVSMGVAAFPEDGKDSATLIQNSDRALYEAKHKGRNRVC